MVEHFIFTDILRLFILSFFFPSPDIMEFRVQLLIFGLVQLQN